MYDFLGKALETTILLILWCNGIPAETGSQNFSLVKATDDQNLANHRNLILGHFLGKGQVVEQSTTVNNAISTHYVDSTKDRADQPRSYYNNVPAATPFVPAFDPISVLASLAFLAFLLQSFAALFDRTRSIIPTIISSRRSSSEYGEQFADIEKRVLRSLEEYASLSNDLLENEKENEKAAS